MLKKGCRLVMKKNMKSSRKSLWGCVRSFREEMLKKRETNKKVGLIKRFISNGG